MIALSFRLLSAAFLTGALLTGAAWPGFIAFAAAQPEVPGADAGLPPWVVPVLRLVSPTHVEPTTGVVLPASGRVLVPLAFAADDDEIVVLDGGTDIVRHGRPARLERSFPELGLKVLAVDGLSRRGAKLSAGLPDADGSITLAAFPPAERIEEGAPPLRQAAALSAAGEGGLPRIASETPLPNVSGALLDACGNLLGFSIADGVQSMSHSAATQYRWPADLAAVLEALDLPSSGVPCTEAAADPAAADPAAAAEPEPQEPPAGATSSADPPEAVAAEATAAAEPDPPVASLPPVEDGRPPDPVTPRQPATEDPGTSWWWLGGALVLIGGGLVLHRLRTRPGAGVEAAGAAIGDVPPAAAVGSAADDPESEAADCRLSLQGQYADGRELRISAPVSARAVNLEIGRGGADLVLDSRAVSRRHARLNGTVAALTLSDLGSSNGSSINGVPCLEGEIMYVEPGDDVILGDVRFNVAIEPVDADPDAS